MRLPDALFEQITCSLSGGTPAKSEPRDGASDGEQRRREPRVGVRADVTIIPLTDHLTSAPFEVPLRDLSSGGVGFLYPGRMGLDEQFVVLLPEGRESVAVLCQVAYYQPLAEGVYGVGAKFVRVLRQPAEADADANAALPLPTQEPGVRRRAAS
jgi:hypothetical protein